MQRMLHIHDCAQGQALVAEAALTEPSCDYAAELSEARAVAAAAAQRAAKAEAAAAAADEERARNQAEHASTCAALKSAERENAQLRSALENAQQQEHDEAAAAAEAACAASAARIAHTAAGECDALVARCKVEADAPQAGQVDSASAPGFSTQQLQAFFEEFEARCGAHVDELKQYMAELFAQQQQRASEQAAHWYVGQQQFVQQQAQSEQTLQALSRVEDKVQELAACNAEQRAAPAGSAAVADAAVQAGMGDARTELAGAPHASDGAAPSPPVAQLASASPARAAPELLTGSDDAAQTPVLRAPESTAAPPASQAHFAERYALVLGRANATLVSASARLDPGGQVRAAVLTCVHESNGHSSVSGQAQSEEQGSAARVSNACTDANAASLALPPGEEPREHAVVQLAGSLLASECAQVSAQQGVQMPEQAVVQADAPALAQLNAQPLCAEVDAVAVSADHQESDASELSCEQLEAAGGAAAERQQHADAQATLSAGLDGNAKLTQPADTTLGTATLQHAPSTAARALASLPALTRSPRVRPTHRGRRVRDNLHAVPAAAAALVPVRFIVQVMHTL